MRVLVVEDDDALLRAMSRVLPDWFEDIVTANSIEQARGKQDPVPNVVILDVKLPDGDSVELARELAELRPMPLMIAISGEASPKQAFQLNEIGVRAYLSKPFSLKEFRQLISEQLERVPDIKPGVVAQVGKVPLREVGKHVRKAMLEQALSASNGNITHAANMLMVSRQAVQQMLVDFEIDIKIYQNQ